MIALSHKMEEKATNVSCNACKLCAPLGACMVFRGIEGAVPFLHGSQGCSTYIRRYMISHFKEPLDIASSNFSETSAIFGGQHNMRQGLENVIRQYNPKLIGITGTCLAETIGDDVGFFLRQLKNEVKEHPISEGPLPALVHCSSPSYAGTHAEGFLAAVLAVVNALAEPCEKHSAVNVLPGMVSPADLRHLKELFAAFGIETIMLPDYSMTLDGGIWDEYQKIPPGGTPIEAIRRMGGARATIEFGATWDSAQTAGALLQERFGVPRYELPPLVGVRSTDMLIELLEELSGRPMPTEIAEERGRLIDSFVDAHKYVFGNNALVYGEQDLVVGIAALLSEIGITPLLCASGAKTGRLQAKLDALDFEIGDKPVGLEGIDFDSIESHMEGLHFDLAIGSSKGYHIARKWKIPLVRVGFPIHDRIGGARILRVGYRGAQQLFDTIVNALIETTQDASPIGYSYM